MHPTQQPTRELVDRSSTPAAVLRHAAIYLWRYGWTQAAFYMQPDPEISHPFPPACMIGAIRAAVFGKPMEDLYTTSGGVIDDPHQAELLEQVRAAQLVLAAEVDPDFDPDESGTFDVIADWNDTENRTIADVLIALYAAADQWDATQPLQRSSCSTSPAVGQ
jgi:hypothetical protein